MSKRRKTVKQLIEARNRFSARGSNCPICNREFRDEYSCRHSIADVNAYFDEAIFNARMKEAGVVQRQRHES